MRVILETMFNDRLNIIDVNYIYIYYIIILIRIYWYL